MLAKLQKMYYLLEFLGLTIQKKMILNKILLYNFDYSIMVKQILHMLIPSNWDHHLNHIMFKLCYNFT